MDRLTKFTSQNLKKLISHMNLDAFFANVDKVAVSFTREIKGIWHNYLSATVEISSTFIYAFRIFYSFFNVEAIFAVLNTISSSGNKAWKKIQAFRGSEPKTSVIPVQWYCSGHGFKSFFFFFFFFPSHRPYFHNALVFITANIAYIFMYGTVFLIE